MISVKIDPQFACPECGEWLPVPDSELALGRRVRCRHCGAESCLDYFRDTFEEPPAWRLESVLPEEEGSGRVRP